MPKIKDDDPRLVCWSCFKKLIRKEGLVFICVNPECKDHNRDVFFEEPITVEGTVIGDRHAKD